MKKIIALFLSAALVFGIFLTIVKPQETISDQATKTLEQAILQASVRCYAVEGIYPPTVEYLEKNYGIMVDHKKYIVDYDCFASNIIPSVRVTKKAV